LQYGVKALPSCKMILIKHIAYVKVVLWP